MPVFLTQRSNSEYYRYDARLLLDTLPTSEAHKAVPSSPTGWSDLPSDSEDTFFLSADEVDDYRRVKRRRTIDADRAARLQALHLEHGEEIQDQEQWGGSDEEVRYIFPLLFQELVLQTNYQQPDNAQKQLMDRTARHLLNSPNPAQLEMRILANHGADRRFAFLKGRWSRAWKLAKGRIRLEIEEKTKQSAKVSALDGLVGYGGSDSDNDDSQASGSPQGEGKAGQGQEPPKTRDEADDESVKEARRVRAREWAEKRRAAKLVGKKPVT